MTKPIPPSFRLLAGDPKGRKHALIVHGILSKAAKFEPLAKTLVQIGHCDAAWGYDSWAFKGRTGGQWGAVGFSHIRIKAGKKIIIEIIKSASKILLIMIFEVLRTPSSVIEGAGQEIAGQIRLLEWEEITLIGHSLGGLVARCALEAHDLSDQVASLVTLATPHQLWRWFHNPEDWEMEPLAGVRYLQILGSRDWVVTTRKFGDFTTDDEPYDNLTKVIYPGLNHTTIHTEASDTFVTDLIHAHESTPSLHRKQDLMVVPQETGDPQLVLTKESGIPRSQGRSVASYSGQWLEFA